jgi:phosphoribosylaminoimidazole-succinocarboxamide synthase
MVEPGSSSVPSLGSYAAALDLPLVHVGKVRELYAYESPDGSDDALLMVATDRISAFDFVLDRLVPDKGAVLTQLSQWWFAHLGDIVENHVLSTDVPAPVRGRAVVCERLDMVPVECVARGYLTGSGWLEYQRSRSVCGVPLPDGLVDGSRLPEPIFTPATKAAFGEHDENVDFETMVATTGPGLGAQLRDLTLAVYARAEEIARTRGLVLADTKLEFGRRADGTLVLADEVLTPDSSRYWDAATWRPGTRLDAFDKQFVRDWLLQQPWDKTYPAPELPREVADGTSERYRAAYDQLADRPFSAYLAEQGVECA